MNLFRTPFPFLQLTSLIVCLNLSVLSYGQGVPLSLGDTNTGVISLPAQEDRFTFTGATGQRLYFDRLDLDGESINPSMTSPSGANVFSLGSASDHGPFYLTEAGTYTLLLDGSGDVTGNYSFRLMDLTNALPITYGVTNAGQLAPQSRTMVYRFNGTNGQRLSLRSISASSSFAFWRLLSPANQSLAGNAPISGDLGEVVLPATGTYLVLVEGYTETIGVLDFAFAVSLVSNSSGVTSGFGSVLSGTVLANETNSLTVTGPAGLPVYFDALTNNSAVTIYFISPSNEVVFTASGQYDAGPYILPRSGSYTVDVVAGASDADFVFRLLDLDASSIPITVGTIYEQDFTAVSPFRADVYRLTGSVGQRVYLDSLEYEYDNWGTLYRPDGQAPLGTFSTDMGPLTLDLPGAYFFVVGNASTETTSDYLFRWLDAAQPPTLTVPFDTTVEGLNAYGSAASLYRLSGGAGQRLYFDGASTNATGSWTLFGPNGGYINGGGGLSGDFEVTLPGSGTYLLVAGNSTITNESSFSFRIITPPTTNVALTLGDMVSGELNEAGEEDRYTFTGTAGQRLYYDPTRFDQPSLSVFLLNPAGSIVHINQGADYDAGPFTLTESGTYTLLLKATTDVTGSYNFRLIDVTQSPAMAADFDTPINGLNLPASSASVYRFTGTSGQRLFFDSTGTNAGNWRLHGPDNTDQSGLYSLTSDFEVQLPFSGTYVLVAGNLNETNAASFSFQIITPTTTTNALTLGATVSGALDEPGEEDRFTFNGTVGQRIWYDALQADFENITTYLMTPSGGSIFGGNSDSDYGMLTLSEVGTYTLVQKATSEVTGGYSFRLLDLAAGSLVTYDTTVSNQLNPQISSHLYRISGVAGQRIGITNLGASSPNATWLLLNPGNVVMASGNILSHLGEVLLPSTGTYALVVQGNSDLIGGLTYQFRVSLISSGSGSPSGFGTAHSGNTAFDQTNTFSYSGPAGRLIYFDALTNSSPTTVRLIDSNGDVVFTGSSYYDAGPYSLPRNGNYTLEVVGTGDGSYDFRLLDVHNNSVSVTFGTSYTQALTPPFRTDFYRFDATNGQRIFLDAEEAYFSLYGQVYQTIYSPSGSAISGTWASYDLDAIPFTETGTYYLAMAGATATEGIEYAFRLLDAALPPTTVLTLDTTVSGMNDPGTRENLYRFTGSAGQRLFFNAAQTNSSAGVWYVYGPNGGWLTGSHLAGDFEVVLPTSGQYVLTAGNSSTLGPVGYSFEVITPNSTTNPLSLATITAGSLVDVGEEDWFTFTVIAGQRLYYDALDKDAAGTTAILYDSVGNVLFNLDAESDSVPFTVLASGTCRLRIKHSADGTGSYAFRILDTTTATTLPYDTVINGDITNTYGAQLFHVPAMANLDLIVDGLGVADNLGIGDLYNSNNALLGSAYFATDMEITPGNDSVYLLVLRSTVSTNLPYSFRIVPGNHAPVLAAIGNRTNSEMALLTFTATATDQEVPNDQLAFSLSSGAPAGASIHPVTGLFMWTPHETNGPGVYPVTVRVTDNGIPNFSDSETFNITVNEVNLSPALTVPGNQVLNELVALNVSASATDPDFPTNVLTFSLISPPAGMTINANSGAIAWTPSEAQGPFTNIITVVVTDTNPPAVNAKQLSVTNTFQIVVNEINVAPGLPGQTNRTINELTLLTVTNTAIDSDLPLNGLTYVLTVSPPGASVSTNGVITWTPGETQGATTNVFTTVATDTNLPAINAQHLSATNTFTVVVNEVNVAPVLTLPPNASINELAFYTNNATATDADSPANPLTFALVSGPSGLNVSPGGAITWVPTEVQGPGDYPVQIRVTDTNFAAVNASSLSATNTFTLTVNEVNLAPTMIPPADRTIHAGITLSATATATDPDLPSNALTFAKVSGPASLTVSPAGLVTWATSDAHANTTNTITLRVTDNATPELSHTNSFLVVVRSRPVFTSIERDDGSAMAVWTAISGTSYRLQYRTNITDAVWVDLAGDVVAGGATATKTDSTIGTSATRFYRVFVLP